MISDTCRSLIAESRRFSTTYGAGFFNHLPMALLALERLGGDEARLRQFAAFYEKRLRLQVPGEPLPNDDWREALGQRRYESALAAKFDKDLRTRGATALLRDIVPHLTSGLASEAFHGAIRVAYAVDSGDDVDVAGALASWVTGFSELPGVASEKGFASAADAFAAIGADDRFAKTIEGRSIDGRLARVIALPEFAEYRSSISRVALPDLAIIAARIFIATGDFVALHLVTACHAVRVLDPFLLPSARDVLATAMLAAYVAIGRPPLATMIIDDGSDLASRAVKSDDDHDLKLVYCCLQEEAHYKSGLHRTAAAVRLGLL
jgi:questin oxidase-like protein